MAEGGANTTAVKDVSVDGSDIVNKVTRLFTGVEENDADIHKSNPSKIQHIVPEIVDVHQQLIDMRRDKVAEFEALAMKHACLLKKINALGNNALDQHKLKLKEELEDVVRKLERDIRYDILAANKLLSNTSKLIQDDITSELQMFASENCAWKIIDDAETLLAMVASKLPLKFEKNNNIFDGIKMDDAIGKTESGSAKTKDKGPSKYVVKTTSERSIRVETDEFYSSIIDICQLLDGTILVVDPWNRKVKRLDCQLSVTDYCEFEDEPEGICPISATEVVVRFKYSIQFIHVGKSLLPGRRIKLSITASDFYNKIAFCDGNLWTFGDNCVCIISTKGDLVKRFNRIHEGETILPVYDPFGIAVSNDGNKVYVTANKNQLLIFKKNGDFVKQCVDERLLEADSITVSADDIVLVDCHISKKIIMFDSDGNSLGELAVCADMLITEPLSICFDQTENRLLVGFESTTGIQVYELSKGQ